MAVTMTHAGETHDTQPVHPKKRKARVLLTSVFGPYAQDDEYGSRTLNPMELYHNQVTRVQGPFSLRMFHRSWGLMMIQANISTPTRLLDFPTLDRFIEELRTETYDIIGITSIIPNVGKVAKMCELIREHQPQAKIVIGGHVANMPDLRERIDADHIVQGEGVRWMRQYVGDDPEQPVNHPYIMSGIGARMMGMKASEKPGEVAATLIPSVGCPMGCNFCSTSAMFGGKGKCIHFYETGEELFRVMCELERVMKVRSFFVMDENFLLHKKRALRLLELMEENNKAWSLYVFSSANVLRSYTMEQIVALGVSWVWMGLEGENSKYVKLKNMDTVALVKELQSHGIRVMGSTIVGLDEHTPENFEKAIDYAISHDTDFHQFMLYTPIPGTALYRQHQEEGRLLPKEEFEEGDIHGQLMFNYRHRNIPQGLEGELILKAFQRDFEVNGPSIARIARTLLQGWHRYKDHADERIRERFRWESRDLATVYSGLVWAARDWFRHNNNPQVFTRLSATLADIYSEFGLKARIAGPIAGRVIRQRMRIEARNLANGWTYEPPTFYELEQQAVAIEG